MNAHKELQRIEAFSDGVFAIACTLLIPGPVVYVPVPAVAPPPLAPAYDSASVTPAPRRPEKFYVIPGCYAGNRPPQPTALPAGCDIQKLRVNTW